MSISKVEYGEFLREGEPGLTIVFTYDGEYSDAYEIWGEHNVGMIHYWIYSQPPPEALLVELRKMVGLTVH